MSTPRRHPTAQVDDSVELGADVEVGPFTTLEGDVRVGPGTRIGPRVTIRGPARLGSGNEVYAGTVIGTPPQDWSYEESDSGVVIGSDNILREYVTVNKATTPDAHTRIGDDNMIMAYCHVAHDCDVGSDIDMANNVNLSGHVSIGDHAVVSGLTAFQQFVRVGDYAMVGGLSRIVKDVVPYARVSGNPLEVYGPNTVGLRRNEFTSDQRLTIKKAFKTLFRDNNSTSKALEELREQFDGNETIDPLIEFVETSERGIHR